MSIDFYYIKASSPCRAVMIVAQRLKIDLNLIPLNLMEGDQDHPDFVRINPAKVVPVINDDGFILAESRAIMMYLINQYSPGNPLYPNDPKKRAKVDRLLFLGNEMHDGARKMVKEALYQSIYPAKKERIQTMESQLKILDALIPPDAKYLTGTDLTIADISMICDISSIVNTFQIDISECNRLKKWIFYMKENLPEYQEMIENVNRRWKMVMEQKMGRKIII